MEWYFEEHLRFPFTHQVRAQAAATSISRYGETLFEQLFGDRRVYGRYQAALQEGMAHLTFEIAGSPEFQRLHWEALKDPDLPRPFALDTPFVRRNLSPRTLEARVRASPTINVLVVTARPGLGRDVGYRTISRPLVAALRQAGTPVQIEILRPGSYAALAAHLAAVQDSQGAGYYHVIHFDVHGALLPFADFDALEQKLTTSRYTFQPQRYGRARLAPYAGVKAFLFLESGAPEVADPVEATELANLLLTHQIPIAILNACQSAKYKLSDPSLDDAAQPATHHPPLVTQETSLGSQLMSAGMQMVLAMGYSVTVSAAEIMMGRLYQQLFQSGDLAAAIRSARLELHNRKERRAYFNQTIALEDWLLPVVYQNQPQRLTTRPFTDAEQAAYYERQATRYREPAITYGFVGRDLDILHIEQRLLRHQDGRDQNLLLVRGLGGAGKSTLLHHLAAWWQTTGLVEQVAYFGYDERAWSLPQILDALARQLLGEVEYRRQFQPLSLAAQQSFLATRLRATRHLLILDNLESITGSNLAILHTLAPADQRALHSFLRELAGGKTLVLLGSRGPEAWLAPGTFDANVYGLPGLDAEAATTLADRILARHNATGYRDDPAMQQDLQRLITLLDGHPLALEVVLGNLAKQTPAAVLAALQSGDVSVDSAASTEDKTKSILACIHYSHSNLSPDAQQLLLCLAPFTGVINREWLPQYTAHLQAQPALAHLPFDRWDEVLTEAINWGLLTQDGQLPMYLHVQPIFPYFLRTRLLLQLEFSMQIAQAFQLHYDEIGSVLEQAIRSNEADERKLGLQYTQIEYENLLSAMECGLKNQNLFFHCYSPLYEYLLNTRQDQRRLELCNTVLAHQNAYPIEKLEGDIGVHFYLVLTRLGRAYSESQQFDLSRSTYEEAVATAKNLKSTSAEVRANYTAIIYHQLGVVAHAQRQWVQAEQHYQHALQLKIEFNDRYSQASTYHQLGMVAHAQRQWAQAEQHYQRALQLFIESNDKHGQARILHSLGMVAQEQRQWTQAEQHYQYALQLFIEFNDHYGQASTYHQLGMVAQAQGQWTQTEQYYQHALQLKIESNDRFRQASTYHGLGIVAQEQQQWMQAEQYYQHALAIYVEYNDRYSQAGIYNQLGMVAQEQRQWAQAEQYYHYALQLKIESNDRYSQASTYLNLGAVAYEQRHWTQSKQYLLQALQIFVEFQDEHHMGITLHNLSRLYRASSDATLPAAVAGVLGMVTEDVAALLAGNLTER